MKKLLLAIMIWSGLITFAACVGSFSPEKQNNQAPAEMAQRVFTQDSLNIVLSDSISRMHNRINATIAECGVLLEKSTKRADSLNVQLKITRFNIEVLKKYGLICVNNPSQLVFLKGWQNRAHNDKDMQAVFAAYDKRVGIK